MKKGFTLVELLIVIGILAILTAAVVIVLNPAELLRQARDSQRMADLDALKSAISLYLADVSSTSLAGSSSNCYVYAGGATTSGCGGRFTTATTAISSSSQAIDGTGWIPVALGNISSGSPLSKMPSDPTNNTTYFYSYAADTSALTFEIDAKLESSKYASAAVNDGGSTTTWYEVGTTLTR